MSKDDVLKNGEARVVIKTRQGDELPAYELDMNFTKSNGMKLMVYAIQLKDQELKAKAQEETTHGN
jgi:hypothetical protein